MTLICLPTPGQLFTPTNHLSAFIVSDQFLGMVGGANIADQRKSHLQASTTGTVIVQLQGNPSWKFWNDVRTHSQSYIKMYN